MLSSTSDIFDWIFFIIGAMGGVMIALALTANKKTRKSVPAPGASSPGAGETPQPAALVLPPEKVKKKIIVLVPAGAGYKTIKGKITPTAILVKGNRIKYKPEHLFYLNGKLAAIIDPVKLVTVPPSENVEGWRDEELKSILFSYIKYESFMFFRKRERTFVILAMVSIVLAIVFASFTVWQYTSSVNNIADALRGLAQAVQQIIEQQQSQPPGPPVPGPVPGPVNPGG